MSHMPAGVPLASPEVQHRQIAIEMFRQCTSVAAEGSRAGATRTGRHFDVLVNDTGQIGDKKFPGTGMGIADPLSLTVVQAFPCLAHEFPRPAKHGRVVSQRKRASQTPTHLLPFTVAANENDPLVEPGRICLNVGRRQLLTQQVGLALCVTHVRPCLQSLDHFLTIGVLYALLHRERVD